MPADTAAPAPTHPDGPAGPVRLHVVTGKGGTGKTTVATALALALAREGRRVLLCEVEGRQGVARLLEVDDLPPRETEVAEGAGGGQVVALAVEPRSALLLYLDTFYRLGRAGAALEKVGAVDFITAVAPGLRDILLVGMVYEATRRRVDGTRGSGGTEPEADQAPDPAHGGAPAGGPVPWTYDAVVLDAPPTGRISAFLGIGDELATLAGGGPIAGQAASVARLLRSPATAVHLVSLLEDLPVQETVEAAAELAEAGLPLGLVVANRVLRPVPPVPADAEVAPALEEAGMAAGPAREVAAGVVEEGAARALAVTAQQRHREALAGLGQPVADLHQVPGALDLAGLDALADRLGEQLP